MKQIILIVFLIFLVGCGKTEDSSVSVSLPKDNIPKITYNIYMQKSYKLKRYEPEFTSYLGMYVENTNGDFIKEFEEFTNTKPNVYNYRLKLGESYPLSWVLNCYSNMKMPFITILPPDDKQKLFDRDTIKDMAKEFGNLHIPMFVNLYPVDDMLINETDYVKFFQDVAGYFKLYAPNVCLVFSIDKDLVYDIDKIYPGDEYVEWVGLDIYEDITKENKLDIMFNELDFLYKRFANKKPIFLNVGISHFGSLSYEYNIDDKIKELERYLTIQNKYSRIKMINYQNYDTFNTNKINKQNYLITDNKKILETYTTFANTGTFAKNINFESKEKTIGQEEKINMLAYKINAEFFVEENFLAYMGIDKNSVKQRVDLNGKTYYKLTSLLKEENKIYIDDKNKKIIIA